MNQSLLSTATIVGCIATFCLNESESLSVSIPGDTSAAIINTAPAEIPIVDIPPEWRIRNWSLFGEGSCVHASLYMLFRWQGRHELAQWWRTNHHSGEIPSRLEQKLNAAGVTWAATTNGDIDFLEWACRTRRGCGVTVQGGAHMVCLVHLDDTWAGLLDNNDPSRIRWRTRQSFLSEWKNSGWQWAVTPIYEPPPRVPWI